MPTTYSVLVSSVIETAENTDTAFLEEIPGMVDRAQYRIARDLDTYGFVAYTTVTGTTGNPFLAKPSAALVPKSLYTVVSGVRSPLYLKTDEYINEYWPDRTSVGNPKYYANWGFNTWLIAPAPSATTVFEISYVAVPTSLTSAVPTNWITDYAPDALFYETMAEANRFMKNWGAAREWEDKYNQSIAMLRNEARRNRRDDQTFNQSPAGGDNVLEPNGN